MKMGGLVESCHPGCVQVAEEPRRGTGRESARNGDKAIDALEELINEETARLIALRSPTAGDLRLVLSVMRSPATWSASATMPRTWPSGPACWCT